MARPDRSRRSKAARAPDDLLPPPPSQPHDRRLPVLLPYPFAGPFDYRVPEGMDAEPGDLVLVPLNRREEVGVVWDGEADHAVGDNRLKPISALLDVRPMRHDLRRLVDWIAGYTLAAPGEVLAMALRINALRPDAPPTGWQAGAVPDGARLTDARRRVLAAVAEGPRGAAIWPVPRVSVPV